MTIWQPNDDGKQDITSHDVFTKGTPHNTFKNLRDNDPCHWTEWDMGKGFWSITRHADILQMNRLATIFSSAQGIRMEDQTYDEYMARRTFQETDPPEHSKFRRRVMNAFSKPVIAKFEQQIEDICNELLDEILPLGIFDATDRLARKLPMRMLGQILGLPEEDLEWLVAKGDELISNTDPEYTQYVLDKMQTDDYRMMPFNSPAGAELYDYAKKLMAIKDAKGEQSGILHMMKKPDKHGNAISENEFRNFFCLLVAAGNDTTRYSLASGMHALANQEGLLQQMKHGDDALWQTAPDEIIRWASPTMYFRRTATQDYELHGKTIKKGDKVIYWFVSANRDERVFDNPFTLDLTRNHQLHIAFGQGGPHVCLGMWLAKLEVKIFFREFCKRVKTIEPAGDIEYLRSNFIGGIKKLPLHVTL
ncbi:MAG: cytochrome P450 [Alphaproteobacteria bacterium]|nr:cytochrome P450 [Alphaproteobacteria bacterium]